MKKILLSICFLISSHIIYAQWDSDPASVNTPVIKTTPEQTYTISVSDGSNGSIIVSQGVDFITTLSSFIVAQKIDANGALKWGASDKPVLAYNTFNLESEYVYLNSAINDGSGGVYIAWGTRIDTFARIYIQHISSTGTVLWGEGGLKVNSSFDRQSDQVSLCQDGAGGVVVVWNESLYDENDETIFSQVYAQRYNSAGTKQWTANGVQVCTSPGFRAAPGVLNDGGGGFVIYFGDTRNSNHLPGDIYDNTDIYAQRLNSSGALTWAAAGVPVSTNEFNQIPVFGSAANAGLISDGAGGSILIFEQYVLDDGDKVKLFAQRLNASGAKQWTANGVNLCNIDSSKYILKTVSDGANGAVTSWVDFRNGSSNFSVYARRVTGAGVASWTADGTNIINTTESADYSIDMTDDGSGNYIYTWAKNLETSTEVVAQKYNNNGLVEWGALPKPVCTNTVARAGTPNIVKSNSGSAIINWMDQRNGFLNYTDVYAAKILSSGTLAGAAVAGYVTVANGNWNSGSTWQGGAVPPATADVTILHDVKVTVNASCNSASVQKPNGKVTVNTGVNLTIRQ
ncbi:MAG: hypothetical protein QM791_16295 [Ferruginibacter sp.]